MMIQRYMVSEDKIGGKSWFKVCHLFESDDDANFLEITPLAQFRIQADAFEYRVTLENRVRQDEVRNDG